MCLHDARRRTGRFVCWMKVDCQARIKSLISGEASYGECTHLSVDGLAVRSMFVPQYAERLEVTMMSAEVGAAPGKPFVVEAEVRRCNELERGRLYEIGMVIVNRKS